MYNYYENVKEDVKEYIKEYINYNDIKDLEDLKKDYNLKDELFMSDGVTGNASGSYYCNTWKAEEALCHNLDLLQEAVEAFCYNDINIIEKGAEWCDVIIRCYLVGAATDEAIEEIIEEMEEN